MNKTGIEDLIAMNALYRPGPEKFIPDFIEGKKDASKIKYLCPQLEPILSTTYGQIVYQEQVMQIVRDLAGYTWGRSDLVRRAMSKKHQDEIDAERHTFVYGNADTKKENEALVPGCIANGIPEVIAHKIWDSMVDFAKYAFNKSHATAYAVTSYWTAFLKYYYPAYYLTNVINHTDKIDEVADDISDALDFGVKVLPPDINASNLHCDVVDGNILYGLSNIKNVGAEAAKIIEDRNVNGEYSDIKDFIKRTNINAEALSSLIKAGAFDCLGYTRTMISLDMICMKEIQDTIKKIREKSKFIENASKVIEFVEDYIDLDEFKERISEENISFQVTSKKMPTKDSIIKRINSAKTVIESLEDDLENIDIDYVEDDLGQILNDEKEVLGVYITGHPIDEYNIYTDPISDISTEVNDVSGIIKNLVVRKDRNGYEWVTFEVEDKTGSINGVCFSKDYANIRDLLVNDAKLCLSGKIQVDDFRSSDDETVYQIIVKSVKPLKKNKSSYRFICTVSEVNDVLDSINEYLVDVDGDYLYWLDSTTGIEHLCEKFINPDMSAPSIVRKC
ncbi:MAG: OB-fold nucleic acid binding domain-containing protein [Lachnospira pectinoschiza]